MFSSDLILCCRHYGILVTQPVRHAVPTSRGHKRTGTYIRSREEKTAALLSQLCTLCINVQLNLLCCFWLYKKSTWSICQERENRQTAAAADLLSQLCIRAQTQMPQNYFSNMQVCTTISQKEIMQVDLLVELDLLDIPSFVC